MLLLPLMGPLLTLRPWPCGGPEGGETVGLDYCAAVAIC